MQSKKTRHPFIGVDWNDWKEILKENKVYYRYFAKLLQISFYSFVTNKAKQKEKKLYIDKVNSVKIQKEPIFILGHWRSGTTLLENIIACDPQFGYLTTVQSLFPTYFLMAEEKIAKNFRASHREMDNVELGPFTPSEEEIAMAVLGPGSFWHGYYFPKRMNEYFTKYVLFENILESDKLLWEANYLWLIKKLTFRYNGKQLLLKNPPNTSRIDTLLKLFPNAKFIHIVRNPYEVYASRRNQYFSSVLHKALQPISLEEWEEKVIRYYKSMMSQHLIQRTKIPNGNYIEVKFEELKEQPMSIVSKIYNDLSLSNFNEAKPHLEKYCQSMKSYKQNKYHWEKTTLEKINNHWLFALEQWNYNQLS